MRGRVAGTLRLLAPVGVLIVLAVAPAEGAAQGKSPTKLTQVTATSSATGSFNVATATATCPAGKKAVAGGYTTSPPHLPSHWLNVFESRRVGQTGWRVSGVEFLPAPATDTLAVHVYCQRLRAKVITSSVSVPLSATLHGTSSVLALCPAGTKALSGGFIAPTSNAVDASYVSRSTVAGNGGWVVDATNLNGTAARSVFALVYCAKVRKAKQESASTAVLGPINSVRTASTPACAKGTTARGGGFATSAPMSGLGATALVYETRRVGASWVSSASASSNSTKSTLVSTALCR